MTSMDPITFFITTKPLFTLVHILSVIVGMGAALLSDLLFNLYARDRILTAREVRSLDRLSRTVWIALGIIILSGA